MIWLVVLVSYFLINTIITIVLISFDKNWKELIKQVNEASKETGRSQKKTLKCMLIISELIGLPLLVVSKNMPDEDSQEKQTS